jgi:hypothetical protein
MYYTTIKEGGKMKVIKTKYVKPTNTKGSRIKAIAGGFSVIVPYDYALSDVDLHYSAVKALVLKHKLDWDISDMGYGSDNGGYYFTFKDSKVG